MQLNRQIINLLGVVLVGAVLAAGILVGAMPLYLESRSTQQQADEVAQTNETYEVQVQALRKDAERIDEIEADLEALRAQIPATPQLDDAFELVNEAAAAAGVLIQSARASDAEPWTAPTAPEAEEPQPTPITPDAAAGAPGASGAQDATADAAGAATGAEGTGGAEGAGTAATPPATPQPSPEVQVPFTVIVVAGDTASAARFAEALGAGPRLLGITHANMTAATDGYTLTLDALAFIRTEQR